MNSISERINRRMLMTALAFPWLDALAQTRHADTVKRFDAKVWDRLLHEGMRPAAYVFTTTYCSTCPAVFELLHETVRMARQRVELAAVVMDAQGERALAHAHHYKGITSLYAFDGFEPEIRQAVDPKWRNITPYVVLLDRRGRVSRGIGTPDGVRLAAWLE
jgi:hypothetical protein